MAESARTERESPTPHPFAPYVPRIAADWLADAGAPSYQEVPASVVFIDISGFTRLSEHLARRGRIGAEELADAIGSCFAELLTVAYEWGGELLKFGGDAMFLLFRGPGHEATACAAAVAIRRALRSAGRVQVPGLRLTLRMSIGVESGVFHLFLVGDSHRELIVAGPATSRTVAAESAADTGEIVVGPGTVASLRSSLLGAPKGPGRLLRQAPDVSPEGARRREIPDTDLAIGVPAALRTHLLADTRHPEHRMVSVAFIHFDGTDEMISSRGVAITAGHLGELVTVVQAAADRRELTFLATDVDQDGGKIILTAGAPTSSEDDERRLFLALREVLDTPLPLPIRVGVNRGAVFAGDVGMPFRRTYTVMGDAVNLAARLMARAAPGELLATNDAVARVSDHLVTTDVEPFFVKGKEHQVEAVRVDGVGADRAGTKQGRSTANAQFVGRDAELRALLDASESAAGGHGVVVQLVGPPGLGKSRLLHELHTRAPGLDRQTLLCHTYESTTPYFPFRLWLRELLGIEPDWSCEEAALDLERSIVQLAPELAPWTPLVASVMDIPMPPTPETLQLEARFRGARLGAVITELLASRLGQPTMLVVEDAHSIDDASADLLGHLARNVSAVPWLLCVTARDELPGLTGAHVETTTIKLEPLGPAEATQLAYASTADVPLAPHELTALTERAGGNPLFLTELLAARAAGETALPDSLEALITARIDRLPPPDRALLRRASVLGETFPEELLRAVVDELPEDDSFWQRVEGLLHRDDGDVSFGHTLVRDGAYSSLSYRLRRELHARAGDEIRRRAEGHAEAHADLLSFHYFHAQRFDDAWLHTNIAADHASDLYANAEASELYERALECGRHLPSLAQLDVARLHEKLGDVSSRLARYNHAELAYRAARTCVKGDPAAEARLMLRIAWVIGWRDGYSRALRWITMGLRTIEGLTGPEASRQRSRLLAWYGQFCQQQGHHRRAMKWCRVAVTEAEHAEQVDSLAHALKVLGWAEMDLGQLDSAPHLQRSLELYEFCDDLPGQASVHNLLGGFAYWRGEWGDALESYQHARSIAARVGDMVLDAFCASNIGEIALDQGDVTRAEALFSEAYRVWEAAGDRPGTTYAKCSLARVANRLGRSADAARLFEEAEQESRAVGAQFDALEARVRRAEGLVIDGRAAAALELADDVLDGLGSQGAVMSHAPLIHRIRGAAFLQLDQPSLAREALETSLASARSRQADYEVALTLELLAELALRSGDPAGAEHRRQSSVILARLQVQSIPDMLARADQRSDQQRSPVI